MLGNQLLKFCFVYVLKLYVTVFFFPEWFSNLTYRFSFGHYGTRTSIQDPAKITVLYRAIPQLCAASFTAPVSSREASTMSKRR